MKQEKIWREFLALPPELQQQVVDLIEFLRTQYAQSRKTIKRIPLEREPAIGMWRDREEMQDSTMWVKQLRTREWERRRG